MRKTTDRRQFLQAALTLGGAAAIPGLEAAPAISEAAVAALAPVASAAQGKVLFPINLHPEDAQLMSAILQEIRRSYRPDLGDKPVPMPGNGGVVSMTAVRNSVPDGSTAWLGVSSLVTLQPLLRSFPGLDPAKDLLPVAAVAELASALAVGPAVPAEVRTVPDYVRWLQANPMGLSFGTLAIGTPMHMVGLTLGRAIGRPLRASNYKSTVSLADDLQSGALPAAIVPLPVALAAARQPGVRLLAVASDERWPGLPDLPTLRESGLSTVSAVESLGFYLPAGTPAEKVQELAAAVQRAARSETVQKLMRRGTLRPMPADAGDFSAALAKERSNWAALIKQQQITIDV